MIYTDIVLKIATICWNAEGNRRSEEVVDNRIHTTTHLPSFFFRNNLLLQDNLKLKLEKKTIEWDISINFITILFFSEIDVTTKKKYNEVVQERWEIEWRRHLYSTAGHKDSQQ